MQSITRSQLGMSHKKTTLRLTASRERFAPSDRWEDNL